MTSYSDNHDIMWRACDVCYTLIDIDRVSDEDPENEALIAIRRSSIRGLLEQAIVTFRRGTNAYYIAKRTLKQIDEF